VWEKLLAFSGSFIMKPNDAYVDTFITPADLTPCIGTGPFKITEVIPDEKTSFVNFEDYRLGAANITNMVYLAIADGEVASQAMLNHEAHYGGVLPEYLPQAEADPDITIERTKTAVVFYIQMNVNNIPRDARYAMAHAFNYSYYITAITADTSYQIHTPIPDGFAHHNASIVGLPYYNVTLARKILTDSTDATVIAALSAAGITAASTDAQWLAAAESATPVFSYNFTHYTSTTLGRIGTMLIDNMKSIGIKVTDYVVGDWGVWTEWVTVPANKAKMTLSYGGWGPDYNDPINMMEPIYKTGADYNDAMVADSTLDALMASYYEANMTEQADICNQLQHMIAVDICPSFYVQQRGTNIMYNNEYVSHITDNLNVFNNWYWYNFVYVVQMKNTLPGYSFTPMIISFAVVAGFLLMKKRK
jgi:ABC-type oligopeptide transport system substrate-binding subunit